VIIKTCLALAASALLIKGAAAQTPSGPTDDGRQPPTVGNRQLQLTRQQIDRREDNGTSRQDRAVQSETDRLYDEIMRAAVRRGR
jgi:hypothetical protein